MTQDAGVRQARDRVEDVYRADAARLWRALVLHTGNRDRASDAVSEAFTQALARGDELRDPRAWVWKTAFRIAGGRFRLEQASDEVGSAASPALSDDLVDLTRALAKLSHHQRAAAILHYYGGYSLREVATMIGSTRAAVGVHLYRARERLRKELGDRDD
jgi:RNA polymerase sigma factor (sigma-70 family)